MEASKLVCCQYKIEHDKCSTQTLLSAFSIFLPQPNSKMTSLVSCVLTNPCFHLVQSRTYLKRPVAYHVFTLDKTVAYPRLHETPVVEGGGLVTHHTARNGQLKSSGLLLQKLLHEKHITNHWYQYNASVKKCTFISALTQSIHRSCETRDQ